MPLQKDRCPMPLDHFHCIAASPPFLSRQSKAMSALCLVLVGVLFHSQEKGVNSISSLLCLF